MSRNSTNKNVHTINFNFNIIAINRADSAPSRSDTNHIRSPSRLSRFKRNFINKVINLLKPHGAGTSLSDHGSETNVSNQSEFNHSQGLPQTSNLGSWSPILPVPQQQVEHWSQSSGFQSSGFQSSGFQSSRTHSFLRSSTLYSPSVSCEDRDRQHSGARSSQVLSEVALVNSSGSLQNDSGSHLTSSSNYPCLRSGMTCLSCSCNSCHPHISEKHDNRHMHPRLLSFHDLKKVPSVQKETSEVVRNDLAGSVSNVKEDDSSHVTHSLNNNIQIAQTPSSVSNHQTWPTKTQIADSMKSSKNEGKGRNTEGDDVEVNNKTTVLPCNGGSDSFANNNDEERMSDQKEDSEQVSNKSEAKHVGKHYDRSNKDPEL